MNLEEFINDLNSCLKSTGVQLTYSGNPTAIKVSHHAECPDEKNMIINLKYEGATFCGGKAQELVIGFEAGDIERVDIDFTGS